jgi:nitrogen regulatory protein PII-like uncharacterized protein
MDSHLAMDLAERAKFRERAQRNIQNKSEQFALGVGAMVQERILDKIENEVKDEMEEAMRTMKE